MTISIQSIILLCALTLTSTALADRYETLLSGKTVIIEEGETALLIFSANGEPYVEFDYTPEGESSFTIDLESSDLSAATPLPLVGPATITGLGSGGIIGLRIVSTTHSVATSEAVNGTPSNAVVIPSDAAGPVAIILESSTDLITWTAARPGAYGATTANRFFRVRAEQN